MSEKTIKKSELARIVGTAPSYITKLEKKGIFDGCCKGDELVRFKSIEAYVDNYDFKRDSQREANQKNKNTSKIYITKKDLAAAFDLKSATEITRLDKKDVFKSAYDGKKLKRVDALKAYIDFILKKDDMLNSSDDDNFPGTPPKNTDDFQPQTVRDIRVFYKNLITLAKSPIQKANISKEEDIKIEKFLKNQELEKRLVDTAVVEKEAFEMARKVRDGSLSIPSRISSELVGKNRQEIEQILTKEIVYVLGTLADV